jgi:RNA polymerase sigma-70 factor (ECF subfamily)
MTDAEAGALIPDHPITDSLVARASEGDPDAFVALLRPFDRSAFRLAVSILGDVSEAEDALQDANARAWRHLRRVRDPQRVEAWYLAIVGNECRRRLGNPWRKVFVSGLQAMRPARQAADTHDVNDAVRQALRGLSPEQRAVLVLRHYFDLPLEQIASQLGLPLGTVKSRLNRASDRLRAVLTAMEVTP